MGFVIHWHESAMDLHVFPIPIPPPTSLSTQSLCVFPVHQARTLVSCIQPGLVICFTIDNIHVLMLFSRNIPPLPSPTESKSLFCTPDKHLWSIFAMLLTWILNTFGLIIQPSSSLHFNWPSGLPAFLLLSLFFCMHSYIYSSSTSCNDFR